MGVVKHGRLRGHAFLRSRVVLGPATTIERRNGVIIWAFVVAALSLGEVTGDLQALRLSPELNLSTRVLSVRRAVVQLDPKFHPTGDRFLVKEYPKDKESRRFKVGAQIARSLPRTSGLKVSSAMVCSSMCAPRGTSRGRSAFPIQRFLG